MASGYELRDREVRALGDALIATLDDLRKADEKRVEKTIARLVADPDVRRVLERSVVQKNIPTRTFSPLLKGIQNYSSMSVGGGASAGPGVANGNALRKRMSRLAAGGES
jgi:hypothetical protein